MKKLFFFAAFLPLAFVSCTTDDSDTETIISEQNTEETQNPEYYHRDANWTPENTQNVYDNAGKLYYEILDTYYQGSNAGKTQQQIVTSIENIANANTDFVALKGSNYSGVTLTGVQSILNSSNSFDTTASNASLSGDTKLKLNIFRSVLNTMDAENKSVEEVHDYIISFEALIISATNITAPEKKTMLIAASIVRHCNFLRKKDRNKFGTDSPNVTAAVEGNINGTARAITLSAATSAVYNQ